jgi:hypothetical protein
MGQGEPIALEHQRSVVEILRDALRLYRRYPALFAVLAAIVFVPYGLVEVAVTGSGPLAGTHGGGGATVQFLFAFLPTTLVYPLISALDIHALVIIDRGDRPSLGAVLPAGLRVLPVVLAAEIMANLGVIVGLILFIIPGLVLSLRWAVTAQAAAIEPGDWIAALRRSGELASRNYLHVLGAVFVPALVVAALDAGAHALPLGRSSGAPSVAVAIAIGTVGASFVALCTTLLYYDLRARH